MNESMFLGCLIPELLDILEIDTEPPVNEAMGKPGLASLEADPDPVTLPSEKTPLVRGSVRNFCFQFIYRKGIRRITLQRFLVTRLVKFPGTFTLMETLCLYDNLLWCNAKREVDPHFREKFGVPLEVLTNVLKRMRIGNRLSNLRRVSEELKRVLPQGFLYPERNISQIQKALRDAVFVIDGELGKPNSSQPPRTFIGKGYRDHGCLKDTAWDGSPSWQEVAMCHLDVLEVNNADTGPTQSPQGKKE